MIYPKADRVFYMLNQVLLRPLLSRPLGDICCPYCESLAISPCNLQIILFPAFPSRHWLASRPLVRATCLCCSTFFAVWRPYAQAVLARVCLHSLVSLDVGLRWLLVLCLFAKAALHHAKPSLLGDVFHAMIKDVRKFGFPLVGSM